MQLHGPGSKESPAQKSTRSPVPDTRKQQRLVVCLDGTWNKRDDSTNVLHHFTLVCEGDMSDGAVQRKYYDEGVGTGMLDGITGGAFGFGLEENVRDAYNWLAQNYQGETEEKAADEIYIFGFSRGAYTARSLVGFIGRCGLLRRGSPVTVNELWEQYCILGRQHEQRGGRVEKAFGETPARIRQITDLICDPWQIEKYEAKRVLQPGAAADPPDRLPGQREKDLNETEKLLVRWSRRVRITYLGVYDTVGAMGFDALAIPGLKSKLALHHNMRPTTLIQSCRHALAIDEHRSSFSQTPFVAYVGHESAREEADRAESVEVPQHYDVGTDLLWKQDWSRIRAMWRRKIEQRWFVGAHSNIGGGYPDNRLAQRPFAWVLEGARQAGLWCEEIPPVSALDNPLPPPRDSFAEFARPFWMNLFRAKRYYRPIDPAPELRASRKKEDGATPAGFALETINEQVDPSVFEYWANEYRSPNVAEYARRKLKESPGARANNPPHLWLGDDVSAHVVLALWATLAALGVAAMKEIVIAQHGASPTFIWCLSAVAFWFALVDWGESRVNFSMAVSAPSSRQRAFLDSIYWSRATGVLLCVVGGVAAFNHLWPLGWNEDSLNDAWQKTRDVMARWWSVPVGGGLGVLLANLLERHGSAGRVRAGFAAFVAGPAVAMVIALAVVLVTCFVGVILAPVLNLGLAKTEAPAEKAAFAGLLLLLQLGVMYFLKALAWCGEPMAKANLGSIIPLQFCATPAGVQKYLDDRCHKLTGRTHHQTEQEPSPDCAMCKIIAEALWRDIIGFIPAYSLVAGFGLWFAGEQLDWKWLAYEFDLKIIILPLWLAIVLVTAAADYIEDSCHLRYLWLHARNRPPKAWLTGVAFTFTLLKFVGLGIAGALTLAAICEGTWLAVIGAGEVGWRGLLAILISLTAGMAAIVIVVAPLLYRAYRKKKRVESAAEKSQRRGRAKP
jgi:uncharacterized protein (DUF2235 family)